MLKKLSDGRFSPFRLVVAFLVLTNITLGPLAYSVSGDASASNAAPKSAAASRPSHGGSQSRGPVDPLEIPPEGLHQIAALLAEKDSRTPAQRKIDSQLLQAIRESRGQEMAPGVHLERVKIKPDAAGNVLVDITATVTNGLLGQIQQLGGTIVFPSVQFRAIRASVPMSAIETIAGYPGVTFVRLATPAKLKRADTSESDDVDPARSNDVASPVARPVFSANTVRPGLPGRPSFAERAANVRKVLSNFLAARANASGFIGLATSQGVKAMQADTAMLQYGFEGEGVKVAVLSDSFNYLGGESADIASGDLPGPGNPFGNTTPVTVLQDLPSPNALVAGTDEGRAMLQIVHDMAPKAQLFFATAFVSEAGFATNIETLRSLYNCDIICDDVSYSDEAPFSDGMLAQAVNFVTNNGGLYFSAAGNEGSVDRGTASVWEGDYNDAGSQPFTLDTGKTGTIHNWGTVGTPVNGNIILSSTDFVYSLDWADPLGASDNDYDLFVLSSTGTVRFSSTNIQDGSEDPHEEIQPANRATGDRLVVFKTATAAVRAMAVNASEGRLTTFTTGQTHGHSCAAAAFGCAAVAASAANTTAGVFTTASRVESFSSDGPRRMFFNPDGTPFSPGNFTFASNGFFTRIKPDVAGADDVSTSGHSLGAGLNPFSGTSAATPHCGAVAALLKSANPTLTPSQIRSIMTNPANVIAIETAYAPLPNAAVGYGLLDANEIVAAGIAAGGSPGDMADLALGTVTVTEGAFSNHNGFIDPGEYANVVVQLTDPSLTAAMGVSATLTTTTPGVTIVQGTASYGTIAAAGNASNTGTPFVIAVSQSVPCGTSINLGITATPTNGIPLTFPFSTGVGSTIPTISGTLSLAAPVGAGFTSASGTKLGTLARAGGASSCANVKSAPLTGTGSSATTGGRYAAFTFTNSNPSSQCVTAVVTSGTAANLQTATFNNSGFVAISGAASLAFGTNYLADPGTRAGTMTYAFTVPAGQQFTTVIYDATTGGTAGATTYTLTVSLATCVPGPICNTISISPNTLATGSVGSPYSQTFTTTGGSGNYTYSLSGGLPGGLTLGGNTLSGTPTQGGTFPLVLTANDDAGCPSSPQNYTLTISGTTPALITATGGTPQTGLVGAVFTTALQATVTSAGSSPLSGVNVVFAAPASGPTGTFPGGLSSVMVVTDVNGHATAPAFTANTTTGAYSVTASVVGLTAAGFSLNNSCPGSFVVTSNADSGPGTLRDLITNACAGAVITFSPSVTGTITLTSGELDINKAVTITGPGANVLSINGNGLSRVFDINMSQVANTVTITGLTITNGATHTNGTDFYGGGGVLIIAGTVTLSDDAIVNNDSSNSGNPFGGGVDNEGGTVTITRCSITGNTTSEFGGGVFTEGTSLTISATTITGNSASDAGGGGGLAFATTATLTDCTVFGNTANTGGNIFADGGTLTFGNTIIAGGILAGHLPAGADINGTGFTSADYNLIEDTSTGTITGTTTHNITGTAPGLLPLANYGGPTSALLPAPTSPVINAGNPTPAATLDQRSFTRLVGTAADIGAIETNYVLTATGGGAQFAIINTAFGSPLQATVTESGNDFAGATVTFAPPGSGASGSFAAGTPVTNANGIATSPVFTANGTAGGYSVTASIGPAISTVAYSLTNTGAAARISATSGTPQSTGRSQPFATPLTVTVLDASSHVANGAVVTFTIVANAGSSGTFPGNATSAMATTAVNGEASAPTLTANAIPGTFTVNATVAGVVTPAVFTLTTSCPTITVGPGSIPQGTAGVAYTSTQFTQTGGVGAVTFSETGALPTGLTLSSAGSLSGTPLKTGSFPITVTATDSNGCPGSKAYTLVIVCPTIAVSPSTLTTSIEYEPYQAQFTQTGGVGSVAFTTASTLPTGLTLSSAGLLSGTPTQGGTFPITVTATDSNSCKGSVTVSLKVTILDKCMHDDHTGAYIQFSSTTGDYLFTYCGAPSATTSGEGTITTPSGILTITDKSAGKNVKISYNLGSLTGTALVTISPAPGISQTYTISDTNPHPVCLCAAP
jgi:hypothetical protein